MNRIVSFSVDHLNLPCGVYISRQDGDIVTYDIRTRSPNREPVMDTGAVHTVEHLFATYIRNAPRFAGHIIYFGPMGCRTGFYLITRALPHADALVLIRDTFAFIAGFAGDIPGAAAAECGNYQDHNLPGARAEADKMRLIVDGTTESALKYPAKQAKNA